ncbi:PP2C family serine/threonine-protein phosphatase [Wukongibacter baidiensis]|uniref:PP2C family protein-serine/threonine phosphatase n=1 Tax=Wukongibacter baidiensis TaxID=1723361 RepID=UPI003D7F981D
MIVSILKSNSIMVYLLLVILGLIILRVYFERYHFQDNRINNLVINMDSFIGKEEYDENNSLVSYFDNATMAIMADGHGKNLVGRKSSEIAVRTFEEVFRNFDILDNINYFFKRSFNLANKEILKTIDDELGGTSVACALIKSDLLHYALAGNVKIFLYRNKEIIPLSEGHTVDIYAKKSFYNGKLCREKAIEALKNKRLLNYLGEDGFKEIEIYDIPIKLKKNDIVILMTNGIYESIPLIKVEEILEGNFNNSCEKLEKEFEKNTSHKKENGSIILMQYKTNN